MGSLGQAKTLGGLGSILTLLGLVPFGAGTALVVVGWALILIALKFVSDAVQDRSVFNNSIIGAGLKIVSSAGLGLVGLSIFAAISGLASNPFGVVGPILQSLVILWVVAMVSSIFLYMSFRTTAERLNVGLFSAGAIVYVVGVALTIILVGFIVEFIAQVLFAVAFFSLPDRPPAGGGVSPPSPSAQPVPVESAITSPAGAGTSSVLVRRFCPKCGNAVGPGASFCPYCGASTNP